MKLCSWDAGCSQETSSDTELCGYHLKVSDSLLIESEEVEKVVIRRVLWRRSHIPGWRHLRPADRPSSEGP
jgi:hypothetical protein